jgi:hypothetical protein
MKINLARLKILLKPHVLAGLGVSTLALGLYAVTLAPGVLEADAGEFQFVAWLPGIAHPTGYPLYTLLGWAWTHWLPVGSVAWRMNLLSAVLAAAAVGMVYAVARQLQTAVFPQLPAWAKTTAAALTAAIFAVTPTFWSQAIIAEVYTLHALFVASILWLALKFEPGARRSSGHWLAFIFGFSFAHHRTTILLLPALLVWIWFCLGKPTRPGEWFKPLLRWTLLAAAPLLFYLYLPLAAPGTPYAAIRLSHTQTLTLYANTTAGFFNHILGTVFSGEVRPTAAGLERLNLSWQLLLEQVGWSGVVLALTGLLALWRRRRFDLLLLTGLAFLAFTIFNLIYFVGDIFVFFIPVWLLVCLWLGLGLTALPYYLAQNLVQRKTGRPPLPTFAGIEKKAGRALHRFFQKSALLGGFVFFIVNVVMRIPHLDQSTNTTAGIRWQQILAEPLPQNAVLISNDRNEIMPMWYFQYVNNLRPDLTGLFPLIVTDPAFANVGRVLEQALASGRPVYLIKPMAGLALKTNLHPTGTLFEATALTEPPQYPAQIVLADTVKLVGYDESAATAAPGEQVTVTLYWQPLAPLPADYTSYVHLVNLAGEGVAQNDHQPGGEFYPSRYWRLGETLRDQHTLTLPAGLPAGVYHWRVGLYYQPEPGIIHALGAGQPLGQLTIIN